MDERVVENQYKDESYVAFISYRHLPKDAEAARKIQKRIERFVIPKDLRINPGSKRLGKVFLDDDELPASSNLSKSITYALDHSQYLLVICTPDLPASKYCAEEIRYFLETHDRDHVLAILVEGEPEESFSPYLLHTFDENGSIVGDTEPLAANFIKKDKSGKNRNQRKEMVRIYAGLLGCSFDTLWQREKRAMVTRIAVAISAVSLILVVFLSVVFSMYSKIRQANKEITSQKQQLEKSYEEVSALQKKNKNSLMKSYVNMGIEESLNDNHESAMACYAKVLEEDEENESARIGALIELQRLGWIFRDNTADIISEDSRLSEHILTDAVVTFDKDSVVVSIEKEGSYRMDRPDKISEFVEDVNEDTPIVSVLQYDDRKIFLVSYGGYIYNYFSDIRDAENIKCSLRSEIDLSEAFSRYDFSCPKSCYDLYLVSDSGLVAIRDRVSIAVIDVITGALKRTIDYGDYRKIIDASFHPVGDSLFVTGKTNESGNAISGELYSLNGDSDRYYGPEERFPIVAGAFTERGNDILWAGSNALKMLNGKMLTDASATMWLKEPIEQATISKKGDIFTIDAEGTESKYDVIQFHYKGDFQDAPTNPYNSIDKLDNLFKIDINNDQLTVGLLGWMGNVINTCSIDWPQNDGYGYILHYDNGKLLIYPLNGRHAHLIEVDEEKGMLKETQTVEVAGDYEILGAKVFSIGIILELTGNAFQIFHFGSKDPFREIQKTGTVFDYAISSSGLLVFYMGSWSTTELWDYIENKHIANLEVGASAYGLRFSEEGILYYRSDGEEKSWCFNAPIPNQTVIDMLKNITSYELDDDLIYQKKDAFFTDDLGNWDELLSVEYPYR